MLTILLDEDIDLDMLPTIASTLRTALQGMGISASDVDYVADETAGL